ncbi:ammonium transporter 2 [Dimargaris cristalligena]|uniref:Ammonium transporter n=1 Tax=Dimargaris cristalligena TaxID=215637 RepID=A0A4P9ZVB8_9FUNG|nr:ammonium transporter 2 [Dimargaris cristalligena]|eukprot:RKP37566.1 ammonium transporter 2 [Dimargaris cristalligena]
MAESEINMANTAFLLVCTCLVFIMIPGLGYFYSGMTSSKSALSLVFLSMLSLAVVPLQWFIWGYSLALSPTGGPFMGNLHYAFFMNVDNTPHPSAPTVPGTVFAIYQCMFSAITPALALGATAERVRLRPALIYLFVWSTLVYDPIAYWTWAPNGFLNKAGVLDYAGGTPVEIASGFAALAYSMVLGRRTGLGEIEYKPHNYFNIMLGTALLWLGWFGFNAGSAGATARAGQAIVITHLAAASGGMVWMLLQYRHDRKLSSFGFCCGAVAGMVAVTPACGFLSSWAAVVTGICAGAISHIAVEIKDKYWFDDALDVFAVHGVSGLVGNILTGVFADRNIAALDGTTVILGGWVNGNWKQMLIQLWACAVGAAWSFTVTYLILVVMNRIPSLRVRMDPEQERLGSDMAEMGEYGYEHIKPQTTIQTSTAGENSRKISGNINDGRNFDEIAFPMNTLTRPDLPEPPRVQSA